MAGEPAQLALLGLLTHQQATSHALAIQQQPPGRRTNSLVSPRALLLPAATLDLLSHRGCCSASGCFVSDFVSVSSG